MKLLSEAAEYALRAVVFLADHPQGWWTVREISEGTRSKPGYLVKVLQSLARAEIVGVQRGAGGGVSLRARPEELTILQVLNAVDPLARIKTCPLGLQSHGSKLCPLHRRIDRAMAMIEREFEGVTIAELLNEKGDSYPLCEEKPRAVTLQVKRPRVGA